MSQYERIVSYLYRYEHGEKRENSGYAKVERREKECRISLQVKISVPVHEAKAYFYIQQPSGIRTIEIGELLIGRNEMRLKQRTEIDNLFGSGESFEHIDGIFIYSGVTVCYATTWKNDYFYQGDWRQEEAGAKPFLKKENAVTSVPKESRKENMTSGSREHTLTAGSREEVTMAGSGEAAPEEDGIGGNLTEGSVAEETMQEEVEAANWKPDRDRAEEIMQEEVVVENRKPDRDRAEEIMQEEVVVENRKPDRDRAEKIMQTEVELEDHVGEKHMVTETVSGEQKVEGYETEESSEGQELKMQSVCEECPLKKESVSRSYGDRILRTLPTMYPFKDVERGCCVKMELQDIGCLPMRFWSLSGNRFLLHGYYCYRHLIFLRENGSYLLGVPGIYNEKEFNNSVKYGFSSFRQIGEEKRHGAFGYWLMKL